MPTITVRLDEEMDARIRRRLERSGETLSDFIRAAVDSHLSAVPKKETPYDSWKRLTADLPGTGDVDSSVTHEARMRENVRAKHSR